MYPLAGTGLKLSHPTFAKPNMYSALLLTTGTLLVSLHASEPPLTKIFVAALCRSSAIEYNWEWAAAVCTAVPHLSVQFVLSQKNSKDSKCLRMI